MSYLHSRKEPSETKLGTEAENRKGPWIDAIRKMNALTHTSRDSDAYIGEYS
jgi:hypothetical protein